MQGARASFKHGRPARARSSNFPVSSKRLTSFKRPASVKGPFPLFTFFELEIYASLHAEIVEVEIEVVAILSSLRGNFAELNRTVTCMVLKANDRRASCPCHDEFRGPRSNCVRQVVSRITTPNEDRYLAVTVKRNRRSTTSYLSQSALFSYWYDSFKTDHVQTLRAFVYMLVGLSRYVPLPNSLSPAINLVKEAALWTPQQWSCAMFSDESRFGCSLILARL
ncbi:transposable element Tcb1 transposase [Trichonephila clavipes]|nr:transposable element Tcb1 transposase [Trichonephila clavipes]